MTEWPFFVGEVVDIRDPDRAGKCQICVYNHHNVGDEDIAREDLPWAIPAMNNTPSLNKIGSTSNYVAGTTVHGYWLDPETKQIPVILGSTHRAGLSEG